MQLDDWKTWKPRTSLRACLRHLSIFPKATALISQAWTVSFYHPPKKLSETDSSHFLVIPLLPLPSLLPTPHAPTSRDGVGAILKNEVISSWENRMLRDEPRQALQRPRNDFALPKYKLINYVQRGGIDIFINEMFIRQKGMIVLVI